MKIIKSNLIFDGKKFLRGYAIAFNETIVEIEKFDKLYKKYSDLEVYEFDDFIVYPGFINIHTHLEFSANRTLLKYGNFLRWLYSVIEFREEISNLSDDETILQSAKEMLDSGVTTIGAISSFGKDLNALTKVNQRVIYFNEVIGQMPESVDILFNDFKDRLFASIRAKGNIIPAVAIHAPYSVHPIVVKKALEVATSYRLLTTAHLLESKAEREWLENNEGEFRDFFKKFFNREKAVTTIEEFIRAFDNKPTLFVHLSAAKKEELKYLISKNHKIVHCPRSNRLLGNKRLKIEYIDRNHLLTGTDGYSSNYSLNILDELRAALMMHIDEDLLDLSLDLIKSITSNHSNALNLNIGSIKQGFSADFAIFKIDNNSNLDSLDDREIALYTILYAKEAHSIFIEGKKIK